MRVPFRKGGYFEIHDGERFELVMVDGEGTTAVADVSPEELDEIRAEAELHLRRAPARRRSS